MGNWSEFSNQDCKRQMSLDFSSRGIISGFGKAKGELENVFRKENSVDASSGLKWAR
jgi:hypothetical protein